MNKNKFTYKFVFWLVAWVFLISMFSAATAYQPANIENVSYKTEIISFAPNAVSQTNEYLTSPEGCGCSQSSTTSYKVLEIAEEENNEPSFYGEDCCCDDNCFYENCRLDIEPIPEHNEIVLGVYGTGYDNGTNIYLNGTNSVVLPLDFLGDDDGEEEVKSHPLVAFIEGGDFKDLQGEPHMMVFEKIYYNASYNTSEAWDNQVTPDLKDILDYKNQAINLTASIDDQTTLLAVIRIIYFGCMEKITANIFTREFINETDQTIFPVQPYNESAIIYPWISMEMFGEDTHPLPGDLYNFSIFMYDPAMMVVTGVYDTDPAMGGVPNIYDVMDLAKNQINLTTTPADLEIWVEMEITFYGNCGCKPYEMIWSQFEDNGTTYTYETVGGGDYIDLNQYPGYNPEIQIVIMGAWENSTFDYTVQYPPFMQLDTSILVDYNLSTGIINLSKNTTEPIALYFLMWQCCVCPTVEARLWLDGVINGDTQEQWTLNATNGIFEMPWGSDSKFYPHFLNQTGEMGDGDPVKFEIIGVWQNATYNFEDTPENQMAINIFDQIINQTHYQLVNSSYDGQALIVVVDIWWREPCLCENYFWEGQLDGQPIKVSNYNGNPVVDFNTYNYGFNQYQELVAVFYKTNFSDAGDFWLNSGNLLDNMNYNENRAYLFAGTTIDEEVVIVILDQECKPPCQEAWIEWDADGTPFMASEYEGMIILNFTSYDFYMDPRIKVKAIYNASTFDEKEDWFNQPDNFLQEMRYMENYAVLDSNVSLSWELVVILEKENCCWHTETWDWNGADNTPIYAENVNGQSAINMMELGINMGFNSFVVGIYNASEFDDNNMDRWSVPLHSFFQYFDQGYAYLDLPLAYAGITEFVIIMAYNDCASCWEYQIWESLNNQSITATFDGNDWIIDLDTYNFYYPVDTNIVGVFNQSGFNYDLELQKYWDEPGNYLNYYDIGQNILYLKDDQYYIDATQNLVIVIEIDRCYPNCNDFRFEGYDHTIYGEVIEGSFAVSLPNEGINISPGEEVVAVYVNSTFNWNDKGRIYRDNNILDYYHQIDKVAYLTTTTAESLVVIIHVDKCFSCGGFYKIDVNYPPAYDGFGNLILNLTDTGYSFGAEDKVWAIYPMDEYNWDKAPDQQTGWNVLEHFDYQHSLAYLVKDNSLLQKNFVVVVEEDNCVCTSYHDPFFSAQPFPNNEVIINAANYSDFVLYLPFDDPVDVYWGVYDLYLNQSKDNELFIYEDTFWNSWNDIQLKFSDYYPNLDVGDWFTLDISVFDDCGNMGEMSLTVKVTDVCAENNQPFQMPNSNYPNFHDTQINLTKAEADVFTYGLTVADDHPNDLYIQVSVDFMILFYDKIILNSSNMADYEIFFKNFVTFNESELKDVRIEIGDPCGAAFWIWFDLYVIPSNCDNNVAPQFGGSPNPNGTTMKISKDKASSFVFMVPVQDPDSNSGTYDVFMNGTEVVSDHSWSNNDIKVDFGALGYTFNSTHIWKFEIVVYDSCGASFMLYFYIIVDENVIDPCANNTAPYISDQLQGTYYIWDNFTDFTYDIHVKDDQGLKGATYKVTVDGIVMAQGNLENLTTISISLKDYGYDNFTAGDSYVIKIEIIDECGAKAFYDFTVKVLAEGEPIPTDTNTSDTTTTKDDNLSTAPGFEFLFAIFVIIPVAILNRRRRD